MPRYYAGVKFERMGFTKQQKADLDAAIPTTGRYVEAEDGFEALELLLGILRARATEWDEDSPARKEGRSNPLSVIAVDLYGLGLVVERTDKPAR